MFIIEQVSFSLTFKDLIVLNVTILNFTVLWLKTYFCTRAVG